MTFLNFKIAKLIDSHADQITVDVFSVVDGIVMGLAHTVNGDFDFSYNSNTRAFDEFYHAH